MLRRSTLILKLALILIGSPVLLAGAVLGYHVVTNPVNPSYAALLYTIVAGLYGTMIPYFIALYQAYRLLRMIDDGNAFSTESAHALTVIKRSAFVIFGLYGGMMGFIFQLAERDDAPGLILVGAVPFFGSIVIAVFAAVLERLVRDGVALKAENELTI